LCYAFAMVSETPENNTQAEGSEALAEPRFERSAKLLMAPPWYGEPAHDEVFSLGKLSRSGETWHVDIAPDTPTVAISEQARTKYNLKDIPLVSDIRARQKYPELSLVSGGSFLWITDPVSRNSRLACLRRDEEAKVDPGRLTGPAGRSGEPLSQTIEYETNEELMVFVKGYKHNQRPKLLAFYSKKDFIPAIQRKRLRQVRMILDDLLKRGKHKDAAVFARIRGGNDIEMVPIQSSRVGTIGAQDVITRIEGREIDRATSCFVFHDEPNNTLEVRKIIEYVLPHGYLVVGIYDGELFGREASLEAPDELSSEPMVSTLAAYIGGVKSSQKSA